MGRLLPVSCDWRVGAAADEAMASSKGRQQGLKLLLSVGNKKCCKNAAVSGLRGIH
jgi:hypothetical protein